MYVWGLNNYGQLCTGDSKNRYQPELLEGGLIGGRGLGMAKDFCVANGGHHTVVCCDGEVFTCGRKEYGRLGLGKDTEEPNLPTQVELYGWGMGTNLQLEMSDEEDVWTPERVTGKKTENRRTLAVSVGGQHTALLVSNSD